MAELRLGVLGGTFNPIHTGHLLFAESFRERLALDHVLFVPAGEPPHKTPRGLAGALHRYAMVGLAVAGHPAFLASDADVSRPGPSYSVDLLETLSRQWVGARLFLLMGSDTFLDLPNWRAPERLPTWATVAVGCRTDSGFEPDGAAARQVLARLGQLGWGRVPQGGAPGAEPTDPGSVWLVDTLSLPISAREVRRRVRAGESIRYLVPLPVADYVAAHRLYVEPE